jgi:hypothetical protein
MSNEMTSFSEMFHEVVSSPEEISSLHKPKARWNATEDEILLQAVKQNGACNWNSIALSLTGRTGKQCRERWLSKLSPAFTADPWTAEEDATLINLQREHGNQWVMIRASLPRRSTVAIKNRWISLKRKGLETPKTAVEPEPEPELLQESIVCDWDQTAIGFDDVSSFDDFVWGF